MEPIGDVFDLIDWLGNVAAAGLGSFRVYRREPAAAYRETVTRGDRDSLRLPR